MEAVQGRTRQSASTQLGERVRQLRVAAGLTQTELAGNRFSKEYISQIERGKTRPTQETIDWLAAQLKIDPGYLANGVETQALARAESIVARAEALVLERRIDDALLVFADAASPGAATGVTELEIRRSAGEAWARMEQGEIRPAVDQLSSALALANDSDVADVLRAEVMTKLGVGRLKLGSTTVATGLLTEALKLAEESSYATDRLIVEILHWRCACYQRLKDVESARDDASRALELAAHIADPRMTGQVFLQASLVAEREGRFVVARKYAETAQLKFEEAADEVKVGTILSNLGIYQFLLGKPDEALATFQKAYSILLDAGDDLLCANVVGSIATVHLETGDAVTAEQQARHSIALFGDGGERLGELGESQLVLGRALLLQNRLEEADDALEGARATFESIRSMSYLARTLVVKGDVAKAREDLAGAAEHYRHATELLQDIRF
jgi:transcriptional regulator with XRE-family HTH domain